MKIIIFLLAVVMLVGCNNTPKEKVEKKDYCVIISNNNNWSNEYVECDSFKMTDKNHIYIYSDGVMNEIYAEYIVVSSNFK